MAVKKKEQCPTPNCPNRERRERRQFLAEWMADELFRNGSGQVAERLLLETKDKKEIGGLCKGAVIDRLCRMLAIIGV